MEDMARNVLLCLYKRKLARLYWCLGSSICCQCIWPVQGRCCRIYNLGNAWNDNWMFFLRMDIRQNRKKKNSDDGLGHFIYLHMGFHITLERRHASSNYPYTALFPYGIRLYRLSALSFCGQRDQQT